MVPRAETDDPWLVQQAEIMEEDFVIQVRAIADEEPTMRKLEQADWPMLQCHDPVLRHVPRLDGLAIPRVKFLGGPSERENSCGNGEALPIKDETGR